MTSVYPLAVNTALPPLQTAMIRPLNRGVHPFPSSAGEGGRRSRPDGVWPAASTVSRIARPLRQAFDDLSLLSAPHPAIRATFPASRRRGRCYCWASPMTDSAHRLDLLDRMIRIREFEEGVKFLFLEGTMPGHDSPVPGAGGDRRRRLRRPAADDFITSTFRGHGHALAKGLSEQELLDELFGAVDRLLQRQGRIDACRQHEQGHGPRYRHRRRRHSAGGRHGAGVQDAEDDAGRRLLLRRRRGGRGRVSRGREHGGDLAPAGDLRLREQPLRRLDPDRPA